MAEYLGSRAKASWEEEDLPTRWNRAYAEQLRVQCSIAAVGRTDIQVNQRLVHVLHELAQLWSELANDPANPLWARQAATIAASDANYRAEAEYQRMIITGDWGEYRG